MSLMMTRPYAHSKTGMYWLRKVVPADLRERVGKHELVRSLGTKNPKEARRRAPTVLAQFDAILTAARVGSERLTLKDVTALAGEWYRTAVAEWGDDPDRDRLRRMGYVGSLTLTPDPEFSLHRHTRKFAPSCFHSASSGSLETHSWKQDGP
jgi:hypothetical protein